MNHLDSTIRSFLVPAPLKNKFTWLNASLARVVACGLIAFSVLADNRSLAATPYTMSAGDYSEAFGDIANWTANFASGIGASYWGSVAATATGTIPDGVRTTVATATFASGSGGGAQKGTGNIVLLSTGTGDNTTACAIELFLDFTGRNAGNLSFTWAETNNSTGNRTASIRVYTSTDGATYTELTGAAVLNVVNNVATSGTVTNVALPAVFNNSATARIRFYNYNGTGGTTGSRPKISLDNVGVSSTPSSTAAPTVIVTAATGLGTTTASLNANVTADGGAAVTTRGFCYNTTGGVSLSDNPTPAGSGTGAFTTGLTSLNVNGQYFYRAYATNLNGSTLSIETNFWTLANPPVAPAVDSPTTTNLNVTLGSADGNPSGTLYAIQETNTAKYVQADGSLNTNVVFQLATTWNTVTVSGLNPGTSYTFKVKAQNGAGTNTAFGATATGTTASGIVPPALTTQTATALTVASATLNGSITASNGAALTDRGFFWQVTPGVTLADNQLSEAGTTVAAFSKVLTGLTADTIYYYRAYAVNAAGTNLDSADVSFWTLANPPLVPTIDTITGTTLNVNLGVGDGNSGTTVYAIQETNSAKYVQANGTLGVTAVFLTAGTWGAKTVTGLSGTTTYTFQVKARNGAGTETAFSPTASGTTFVAPLTLAGWDVSLQSSYGPSPLAASVADASVTVGGLTRGSGVSLTGTASARAWGGVNWTNADAASAVSAGQYATFSVTPNAGKQVSFTGLSKFDYRRSGTGAASGVVQYQVGAADTFHDAQTVTYPSTSGNGASLPAVDLSTITALQNVAPGTVVTFRIVNYGGTGSGGTWYIYDVAASTANDLEIQGFVTTSGAVTTPVITAIQVTAGTVGIDFTGGASDTAGNFTLLSTPNLTTPLTTNLTATITTPSAGHFHASLPATTPAAFYRIQR